jgi:hypothetical protein
LVTRQFLVDGTIPLNNVEYVLVTAWGGGGGGGGGVNSVAGTSGGGGGAAIVNYPMSTTYVDPSNVRSYATAINVVIGTGGTGGTTGAGERPGAAGTNTVVSAVFGVTILREIVAGGGGGGSGIARGGGGGGAIGANDNGIFVGDIIGETPTSGTGGLGATSLMNILPSGTASVTGWPSGAAGADYPSNVGGNAIYGSFFMGGAGGGSGRSSSVTGGGGGGSNAQFLGGTGTAPPDVGSGSGGAGYNGPGGVGGIGTHIGTDAAPNSGGGGGGGATTGAQSRNGGSGGSGGAIICIPHF